MKEYEYKSKGIEQRLIKICKYYEEFYAFDSKVNFFFF